MTKVQALAGSLRLSEMVYFSTVDAHYSESELSAARFEVHHARQAAQKIRAQAKSQGENWIEKN